VRATLARWIGDADAVRHLEHFRVSAPSLNLGFIRARSGDYYVSLVGELYERMRTGDGTATEWARLGNALAQFGSDDRETLFPSARVSPPEAMLFAASAFYCGGFPASAHLTMRAQQPSGPAAGAAAACFDLLARPADMRSPAGVELLDALRSGDMHGLQEIGAAATTAAGAALLVGPDEWIPARLFEQLLKRFLATNLRAVLPDGASDFWTPLVTSFVDRRSWEFFPSQIEAIQRGLLQSAETFSLQMPTGAGKTALCEALLYWHAKTTEGTVAILLVPFRSLASELRESLVKRLNAMGISARCAYGGTVPTGDEVQNLANTRVMVATPEALSGVLSADPAFFHRISLVICDEGHLLDSVGRGVSLELLLARMQAREGGAPRIVFASAIVPNIEEINSWLGGTAASVVRSDYRPALAEFALIRESGKGASYSVALEMHPHEDAATRFSISPFLQRQDFQWTNPATGKRNTYPFNTVKTQAIAAARKALAMGAAAVFAANKRGNQGAVGLASELLDQLAHNLPLPEPSNYIDAARVAPVMQYLEMEYGLGWIGTRALQVGAVLHHGDIPQETREVVEGLLRHGAVRFAICTTTLAEGVNLPIRTLVLYSVQRRQKGGQAENLLARDIKNLVGRAGRAGATTKGLVICANAGQWQVVEPVAKGAPGENVTGALRALVARLQRVLAVQNVPLTNPALEASPWLHTLIDGIDSTLIDLATEEIGEEELVAMAIQLADQTFASRQATLPASKKLLQDVFALRARRVIGVRAAGRLEWIRDTGTRARMLDSVEANLLPRRDAWDNITDPIDPAIVSVMLEWAWTQPDLLAAIREAYRLEDKVATDTRRQPLFDLVSLWLSGRSFFEIGAVVGLDMDELLGIHSHAVTFVLQTLIEQAVALLGRLLLSQGRSLSPAVVQFPDHLRFGVPTRAARILAARGLRHRRAAVELGNALAGRALPEDRVVLFPIAREIIEDHRADWRARLGPLVFDRTLQDLR
jgi:helicase